MSKKKSNDKESRRAAEAETDLENEVMPQYQETDQHLEAASTFAPTIHLHLPQSETGQYKIEFHVTMDVKGGENLGAHISTTQVIE